MDYKETLEVLNKILIKDINKIILDYIFDNCDFCNKLSENKICNNCFENLFLCSNCFCYSLATDNDICEYCMGRCRTFCNNCWITIEDILELLE